MPPKRTTDNVTSSQAPDEEAPKDFVPSPKSEPPMVMEPAAPAYLTVQDISDQQAPSDLPGTRRTMPEHLRKHLLRVSGNKLYLPAAYRIVWFREECPEWGIETMLIEGGQEAGFATVQCRVYNTENRVIASGIKTETRQDFPAGWVEKAETGSIARALAVAGFGTQFAPEMDDDIGQPSDSGKNRDYVSASSTPTSPSMVREARNRKPIIGINEMWSGPGLCPNCHAPEGKRHGKPCVA